MRFLAFATCFALFVELASGQGGGGAISGSVADPFGHPLAGAAVQAKNGASGKDFKATSSAKGGYTLQGLPPGAYDISVNMPGLKGRYAQRRQLEAGKTMTVDLRLEETTQLGTLGEDTLAITADQKKHAPPSGTDAEDGGRQARSLGHLVDSDDGRWGKAGVYRAGRSGGEAEDG